MVLVFWSYPKDQVCVARLFSSCGRVGTRLYVHVAISIEGKTTSQRRTVIFHMLTQSFTDFSDPLL